MATDFISREDAKDKHCGICEHRNICYQYDGDEGRTYTGRTCIERQCFNTIPAADVRPVVRGKWLPTRDDNKKECSKCHVIHLIAQYPAGRADWCPNCGADMREEPK